MTELLAQNAETANSDFSAHVPGPSRTIKANFAINVVGALVPLAVALVTVPVYIHHIGDARYGVLSIVWVLLGYLGFLDFGLSRAAVRSLARLKHAPQEERARVLVTTLALNLCLGLLGSVVLGTLGSYLLQHVLSVPDSLKPEIARALPWIVVLFPLALVGGVGIGTLESRERFALANVLGVGGTAAGQILPVILAVAVGPSLAIVIPAAVAVRLLTVLLVSLVVWRQERPLSLRYVDRAKAKELFSYGSWLTVSGVISPVLVSLDQFIIGSLMSVTAVTYYAVPMGLVTRSQVFPGALVRTLFPRLSSLGETEARALATRAFTAIAFGYATVCAPAAILAPKFFDYWIGQDFSRLATPVSAILFIGAWTNALAFIPYDLLQSQGRADITGKFHAVEILPFVAVLWASTLAFGIVGAAAAWALRCAIDGLCLYRASGMSAKALTQSFLPFVMLTVAASLSVLIGTRFWLAVPGSILILGISFWTTMKFEVGLRETVSRQISHLSFVRHFAEAKTERG